MGFPKLSSKPVQVLLLRKPHILSAEKIFYSNLQETSHIVCDAEMSPNKAKISWSYKVSNCLFASLWFMTHWTTFQGKELTKHGQKYELVSSGSPPQLQSKLIIKKTEEEDFGTYQVGYKN